MVAANKGLEFGFSGLEIASRSLRGQNSTCLGTLSRIGCSIMSVGFSKLLSRLYSFRRDRRE